MHVLEHAVRVRFRDNPEIRAEPLAPGFGQIRYLELALEKIELEVEPHNHVKAVRHFVGVRADERAFELVDGAVKRVERNVTELAGEEFLQARVKRLPKAA